MKSTKNINTLLSKGLLFSSVLFCTMNGMAQQSRKAVMSDPKLGTIAFTDAAGYDIDAAYIQPGQVIKLRIPVINDNHGQLLPAGTCKIKIGLGSKLQLDPAYDLNNTAMSGYFKWTASVNGGQQQITGDLIAPLPASVDDVTVAFKVQGTILGKSTITANFLVTNHNTTVVVSDEDGTNNAAFIPYTVTDKPAPVSVTTVEDLSKEGCNLVVSFSTDKEINLIRYEVEVAKDGIHFEKMASVSAAGNPSYNVTFSIPESMQVNNLVVRIKMVERSGRLLYSNVKSINSFCEARPVKLSLYPNPVSGISQFTIAASQGAFNGKYKVKISDMAGKTILVKEIAVSFATSFPVEFGNIAAGKYLVQVTTADNAQIGLLHFEKL